MLLPPEVITALLATFTATRITKYCRIAHRFVRRLWLALPLGLNEDKKGNFIQPKLSFVQFGGQSIYRDEEGKEILEKVIDCLFITLFNLISFSFLSLFSIKQPNPLPAACVCFACIAKIWFIQLRLFRLNLIFRQKKFQQNLPLLLLLSGGLAAVVCLPELPIYRHLQLHLQHDCIKSIAKQWMDELGLPNISSSSSNKLLLLLQFLFCLSLLLLAAAAAPTLEEIEDLKYIVNKPSDYIDEGLLHALYKKAPLFYACKLKIKISFYLFLFFLLLLPPPLFSFFAQLINPSCLFYVRILICFISLFLRLSSSTDLVQLSILLQSNDLFILLKENTFLLNKQKQQIQQYIQAVSLVNRSAAKRAAEVSLFSVLLLLLLSCYTLFAISAGNYTPPSSSPPPFINNIYKIEDKSYNAAAAAAAATAAAVCSRHTHAAAATAATAADCCPKTSMLEEVLCPSVYDHFTELRRIKEEKEEKKEEKEEKRGKKEEKKINNNNIYMHAIKKEENNKKNTLYEEEIKINININKINNINNINNINKLNINKKELIGPFFSSLRPFYLLLIKKKKEEILFINNIFSSLTHADIISWIRYTLNNPPITTKELFFFFFYFFYELLFIYSFSFTLLSLLASLRTKREGPSTFSVWGPFVRSDKKA